MSSVSSFGGGGGGGISMVPSFPQHACGSIEWSVICSGVQEKNVEIRIPVKNIKVIFFIFDYLKMDTSVAVRDFLRFDSIATPA